MNTYKISNVALREMHKFLRDKGCKCLSTNGGHEKWTHRNLETPIILQSHIDPVPEFIVAQIIAKFNMSPEKFMEFMGKKKGTEERVMKVARKGKRSNKNDRKK